MKKIVFIFAICTVLTLCLFGCGNTPADSSNPAESSDSTSNSVSEKQFTGISFSDASYVYDGEEKKIEISGALPNGATVTYQNHKGTNAGVYQSTATLTKEGYESLTLEARLTIRPATFSGISFSDGTYVQTGSERELLIAYEGVLPEGTVVTYQNNKATEAGTYSAVAMLQNPNYETMTLHATLTIRKVSAVALDIVNTLVTRPDPWSFFPEALLPENMAYSQSPLVREDFASFQSTNNIGKKYIGKQFNVVYDTLTQSAALIQYVDLVLEAGNDIASLYQTYINNNPDNYASFSGEAGGFRFQITLDEEKSTLLAGNATVNIELRYDVATGKRSGRVQLTGGVALKYESDENTLSLAYMATVSGVGYLTKLEFVRSNNIVVGYLYEHMGAESTAIKTSAIIEIDSEYTRIISNKRETDDLAIHGCQEVYSSRTGECIGMIVSETVKVVDFTTLWLNLHDVSGIQNVKVLDDINGLNADTVFINNMATVFVTKKVGGISLATASRRYDIEMKDVWYTVAVTKDSKTEYQRVKTQIPMLFVQKDNLNTLGSDMKENNSSAFAGTPSVSSNTTAVVISEFEALCKLFETVKTQMSYNEIVAYIGTKHSFFQS